MAEIALRTTEFLNADPRKKYVAYRPVGSVSAAITDERIKAKWLEILCDFPRASKRDTYTNAPYPIPGWDKILSAWSTRLLGDYVDALVGPKRNTPAARAKFWAEVVEPLGLLADLPKDPTGLKPVYETWLWSGYERKAFFIVTNTDATEATVESWNGHIPLDKDGKEVVWIEDVASTPVVSIVPKRMVAYASDIPDLSGETLADIANPEKIVQPRFDKPIPSSIVKAILFASIPRRTP